MWTRHIVVTPCYDFKNEVFYLSNPHFRLTEHKQLVVCVQFPRDYPSSALIIELKSKTIPEKLINGLVKVCDQEIQKHLDGQQVGPLKICKFIC